jgi:hypothetical protein
MNLTDNIYFKVGASYEKAGLDVEDRMEWKPISNVWEYRPDYKSYNERTTMEFAGQLELQAGKIGTFTLGGYYYNEDQKGGIDGQSGYNNQTGHWSSAEDTVNEKDKENTAIFLVHEFGIGNWTFTYGVKSLEELEGVEIEYADGENVITYENGDTTEITSSWEMRDLDPEDGGNYDLIYGIGIEYDFGDDTVASFRYGDPTIRQDSANFMNDGTSFAEGEQDEFTFEISTRF